MPSPDVWPSLPLLEQALKTDTAAAGDSRAMMYGYLGMAYLWAGRLTKASRYPARLSTSRARKTR
jgi:hypothetical protein